MTELLRPPQSEVKISPITFIAGRAACIPSGNLRAIKIQSVFFGV